MRAERPRRSRALGAVVLERGWTRRPFRAAQPSRPEHPTLLKRVPIAYQRGRCAASGPTRRSRERRGSRNYSPRRGQRRRTASDSDTRDCAPFTAIAVYDDFPAVTAWLKVETPQQRADAQ